MTKEKNEAKKEFMRELMTLDKEIFVPKYASLLKPYVRLIYIVLVAFLALYSVVGLVELLTGKLSLAFLKFIFVFAGFIVVRMFCEFLTAYKK
ncbi:MAG: hypothetical protein IKY98_01945 [Alphaproteobacteria bacterium]|nr:hypothetical protein [Alphaproteobacteria bacterium]